MNNSDAEPTASLQASDQVNRRIVWTICLYAVVALVLLPFAAEQGPVLPSFTAFFVAGMLVTELSTSFLLFVWTRGVRTWSLLILGSAYLFGALMSVFHLLTFLGGILPDHVILGTPPQSAAWLFNFWFTGFTILALIAIVLEVGGRRLSADHIDRAIGIAVGGVLSLVAVLVMAATLGIARLPPMFEGLASSTFNQVIVVFDLVILLAGMGLVMRQRNVIFLLLGLVFTTMTFNQILWLGGPARWTLGWYCGRLSWLISACILLLFFMMQFARQQTSLAHSRGMLEKRVTERTIELTRSIEQRDLLLRDVREKTAAIERDAEVFLSIMTTMAEALMLIDAQGRVIYQNSACTKLFGTLAGGELSTNIDKLEAFHLDGITPLGPQERPSARCLRGEVINEFEVLFRPHGAVKLSHLVGSAGPIRDPSGRQTGAVMMYRDVTRTREIEHQLHQSQKLEAMGQLTGGVAHDFNNILTIIIGTAEALIEDTAGQPDLQAMASMIDQAADRGSDLTKQLLAFARKQPLRPRNTDVNKLVLETAKLLRSTLGEHIEIETMLEEDVERAHVDPSQLSTALLNLTINARDAMPNGGKLTLETCNVVLDESYTESNPDVQPGPYVMVAISDNGTGIPANLCDRVFEPFFTTKAVGKGTGLGLSMVYGFTRQSQGHIKIYSEEGLGTTIKLYLPRSAEQAEVVALAATPMVGGAETILVVEDDGFVRDFVVTQLRSLGYETLVAVDGSAALALIDGGARFDLLFTDVIMPGGMNGRLLADEVAKRRPAVKILYTSGYTENAMVHHGQLDAGILLLAKPYRKADLALMMRRAMNTEFRAAKVAAKELVLTGTS